MADSSSSVKKRYKWFAQNQTKRERICFRILHYLGTWESPRLIWKYYQKIMTSCIFHIFQGDLQHFQFAYLCFGLCTWENIALRTRLQGTSENAVQTCIATGKKTSFTPGAPVLQALYQHWACRGWEMADLGWPCALKVCFDTLRGNSAGEWASSLCWGEKDANTWM